MANPGQNEVSKRSAKTITLSNNDFLRYLSVRQKSITKRPALTRQTLWQWVQRRVLIFLWNCLLPTDHLHIGGTMLTEFEVRRKIRDITASGEPVGRQVRMLLKVGRALKRQLRALTQARRRILGGSDRNSRAQLDRLILRSNSLREEVRSEADELMKPQSRAGLY